VITVVTSSNHLGNEKQHSDVLPKENKTTQAVKTTPHIASKLKG
jgi:hypothetical protein